MAVRKVQGADQAPARGSGALLQDFPNIRISCISRKWNAEADALATKALRVAQRSGVTQACLDFRFRVKATAWMSRFGRLILGIEIGPRLRRARPLQRARSGSAGVRRLPRRAAPRSRKFSGRSRRRVGRRLVIAAQASSWACRHLFDHRPDRGGDRSDVCGELLSGSNSKMTSACSTATFENPLLRAARLLPRGWAGRGAPAFPPGEAAGPAAPSSSSWGSRGRGPDRARPRRRSPSARRA